MSHHKSSEKSIYLKVKSLDFSLKMNLIYLTYSYFSPFKFKLFPLTQSKIILPLSKKAFSVFFKIPGGKDGKVNY